MTEGFPKLIRTQRILELTLGCIGHLHGLVEESKGWGLWDPHDPPRLRDRPEACMGRPCILSESPSPGVSDPLLPPPAALLSELRPGGLVPTSSEGLFASPNKEHPGPTVAAEAGFIGGF